MRFKHMQASPGPAPDLRGKKLGPDRLKERAGDLITGLDSSKPQVRTASVQSLGLICVMEHGAPNTITRNLLSLFEFFAMNSPFEDVRQACMEALYLNRDLGRLRSLWFEPGLERTSSYRDTVVSRLRHEIDNPN